MKEKRLIEVFNAWEELSQTPDTIIAYHSRLKSIIDEEAKLDYAEHKGKKKQAFDTAKVLLKNKIEDAVIIQSTSLTLDELEELKNELNVESSEINNEG